MSIQNKLQQIYGERKVTDKEWHLIEEIRKLPFGETHLIVFNEHNQPTRIKIAKTEENILL